MSRTTPKPPRRPNLSRVLSILTGVSGFSADSLARDQTLRLNPQGLEVWTHGEHTEEIPWKLGIPAAYDALEAEGLLPASSSLERRYWCTRCEGLGYVRGTHPGAVPGQCLACGALKCFACEGPGAHSFLAPTMDWIATLASLETGPIARVEKVLQGVRHGCCGPYARFPPVVWRVGEPLPVGLTWDEGGSPRERELEANFGPQLEGLAGEGFIVSGSVIGTLVITVPPIGYEPPARRGPEPPPRPKFEPL